MKKFEVPAIQVENFSVEDVITTSSATGNENQTPTIPGGFGGVKAITPLT